MFYIKQDLLKELTLAEQSTEVYGFHLTTSEWETGSVHWGREQRVTINYTSVLPA